MTDSINDSISDELEPYVQPPKNVIAKVGEVELHDGDIHDPEQANAILDFIEAYWYTEGSIPSSEVARERGIPYDVYEYHITQRAFRTSLHSRGIRIRTGNPEIDGFQFDSSGANGSLTSRQLATANILTDLHDNRSIKRKLSDLQVETQEYQAWMHDPVFVRYINAKTEAEIFTYQYESHLALLDEVRRGNLAAIKYYNELTGRFVQNKDRGGTFDPIKIIRDITEIILEETKEVVQHDKELIPRIGTRLNTIIAQLLAEANLRNG